METKRPDENAVAIVAAAAIHSGLIKDADHIPDLMITVREGLAGGSRDPFAPGNHKPAIAISKSVTPNAIFCLEDGRELRMMKRYLRTHFSMTPEQYRHKWGLPHDYPMVAPNYAKKRSALAKKIGLGKKKTSRKGQRK